MGGGGHPLFTRLTLVRVAWFFLLLFGNTIMASAIIHRDTLPLEVLVGVGLLTFYADLGGALVFLARDADRFLIGLEA